MGGHYQLGTLEILAMLLLDIHRDTEKVIFL